MKDIHLIPESGATDLEWEYNFHEGPMILHKLAQTAKSTFYNPQGQKPIVSFFTYHAAPGEAHPLAM